MEKHVHSIKKHTFEEIIKIIYEDYPTPFIIFTDCGKPFTALGKNKEGFYVFSPYFIVNNILLDSSCIELMLLEPVETDGCLVDYPESFYSLKTTQSCIFVSIECFCEIQTFSSNYVDRELINPLPKDC
jgi:spore coat protein Y